MFPEYTLQGKQACITGASMGIGKDVAVSLAHAGADVVIAGKEESERESLNEVARRIRELGRKAEIVIADFQYSQEAVNMGEEVVQLTGGVDILVNNAGTSVVQPSLEVTEEAWDKVLNVNLKSLFFLTQAIGRGMVEKGSGKIINISSLAGMLGLKDHAAYCASKGGLILLTKVLAMEWGPHGINVNAIAPVIVWTPLAEYAWSDPVKKQAMLDKVPLGRFASTMDIAGAVIFLASPASDMINGVTLPVDGGYTAH